MQGEQFDITLCLTGFIGSDVVELCDDNGDMVQGVFIPIELNGLYKVGSTYWCRATAFPRQYNGDTRTHDIRIRYVGDFLNKIKELGYTGNRIGFLWKRLRQIQGFDYEQKRKLPY